jgi:hypothetical protein
MRRVPKPSPATAIALIALFVAIGGTSYAAVKIDGKNIENRSIPGKKLKNGAVAGKQVKRDSLGARQIKESSLKTVARARAADSATKATTATTADSAKTAAGLTGPAASSLANADRISAGQMIKLAKTGTSPATTPLQQAAAKGPFTVAVGCYDNAGQTNPYVRVTSTEPGSVIDGAQRDLYELSYAPAGFDAFATFITALAPSGAALGFVVDVVANGLGTDCAYVVSTAYNR